MEARANRLAHYLPPTASAPATTSASTRYNSVEWVETPWAVFKLRAVWININYRYVKKSFATSSPTPTSSALVHQAEVRRPGGRATARAHRPPLTSS